jgi:PilZ domain
VAGREEVRVATALRVTFAAGHGVTRNVSATGIYFVTDTVFAIGQSIKLHLEFADLPGGPLAVTCDGRVIRVESEGTAQGVAATIAKFEFRRISEPRGSY